MKPGDLRCFVTVTGTRFSDKLFIVIRTHKSSYGANHVDILLDGEIEMNWLLSYVIDHSRPVPSVRSRSSSVQ